MFLKRSFLVVIFFLCSDFLMAQPPDPGDGVDPDNPVPISGLGYLLMAGAVLGIKKLRDISKRRS